MGRWRHRTLKARPFKYAKRCWWIEEYSEWNQRAWVAKDKAENRFLSQAFYGFADMVGVRREFYSKRIVLIAVKNVWLAANIWKNPIQHSSKCHRLSGSCWIGLIWLWWFICTYHICCNRRVKTPRKEFDSNDKPIPSANNNELVFY